MPCKEEEDEVSGSTFGDMPKVMFFWVMHVFIGVDISIELGRPKMDVEITDFPSEKKYL